MRTAIIILILVLHAFTLSAQKDGQVRVYNSEIGVWSWEDINNTPKWYTNLSVGTTEKKANATTTFQVGVRYQPSILGVKASFNQTDGINHTFDSYTLSATYEPIGHVYFNLGYRYDNGRGWGENRQGVNVGINGLIPLEGLTKIIVSVDHTTTGLTNVMVGLQLRMKLKRKGTNRFF